MGNVLNFSGKPAEALKAHEKALAIERKLVAENPTFIKYQRNLAFSYFHIGNLLNQTGRPAEALKVHESALEIRKKLAEANPTAAFKDDVAASHLSIGNLFYESGNSAEALRSYEWALAVWKKLAEDYPDVIEYQSSLALTYNSIGNAFSANGKPSEAMKPLESSLAISKQLAREHPDSANHASTVGMVLDTLAIIDLNAGRFREAQSRLREAIECQRKALASNAAHPTYRRFLSIHLDHLIRAARGLGDVEGVAEAERELAKLRDSNPAMFALDRRLSAVIKGDQQPKDNAERLQLAQRAYDTALFATAARLWSEALAADSKLGDDRKVQHRYNAVCVRRWPHVVKERTTRLPTMPPRPSSVSRLSIGSRLS